MLLFFVYRKFRKSAWKRLSMNEKLTYLNEVEKHMAKKQKRNALPVVVDTRATLDQLGHLTLVNGKPRNIAIGLPVLEDPLYRFIALSTIFHEGRHAFQYSVVSKPIRWYQFTYKKWKENWNGYIESAENKTVYQMQVLERDAQNYAIEQMKKRSFTYRNEEDYLRTMKILHNVYEQAELDAVKELGIFYKWKVRNNIKKKRQY